MTSPVRAPRPTPRRVATPAPSRGAHLRVVPAPSRPTIRRRRTTAVLCVALVMVFGSLLASAVLHGMLVSGQSKLNHLNSQVAERRATLAREKLELANLQSPARIAKEARSLGMVPAESRHWLSPGTGADEVVTGVGATDTPDTSDPTGQTDTSDPTGQTDTSDTSDLATGDTGANAQ